MCNYDIEQHKRMIEIQLSNNRDEEEEMEKINEIIRNNLLRIFIETGVSLREFALLSDISVSTFKRIFSNENVNVNLKSLLKLSVNLNIPIECLVSNLTPDDIEMIKKFHQLDGDIKMAVENEIVKFSRHYKKERKKRTVKDLANQMDIFEFLKSLEEKNEV